MGKTGTLQREKGRQTTNQRDGMGHMQKMANPITAVQRHLSGWKATHGQHAQVRDGGE